MQTYLVIAGVGLIGALFSSFIAWLLGGSEYQRWSIHAVVALVILVAFMLSWFLWPH